MSSDSQITEKAQALAASSKKSRGLAWKDIKQQINGELDSKGQGTVLHLGRTSDVEESKK